MRRGEGESTLEMTSLTQRLVGRMTEGLSRLIAEWLPASGGQSNTNSPFQLIKHTHTHKKHGNPPTFLLTCRDFYFFNPFVSHLSHLLSPFVDAPSSPRPLFSHPLCTHV